MFPVKRAQFSAIVNKARSLDCDTILISNETLSLRGVNDECLRIIREAAPEFTVKFIIYIRRVDDFCKEWFSQLRKTNHVPGSMQYSEFIAKAYKRKAHILFPSRLVEKCIDQVGKENVIVRNYALHLLVNGDSVDDFLAQLHLSVPVGKKPSLRYNAGLPRAGLPYLTSSSYSSSGHGFSEVQIRKKMAEAFAYPGPGTVSAAVEKAVLEEIDRIDQKYLPDHKRSYEKKTFSLQFPELEAQPYNVYVTEMLHTIYKRVTWPERLVWRTGVSLFFFFSRFDLLRKRFLALIPLGKKSK